MQRECAMPSYKCTRCCRAAGAGPRRGHPLSPLHCYVTILPLLYIFYIYIYTYYILYIYLYIYMDVLLSIYIIYMNIPLLYWRKTSIYIFIHIYIKNTCTWYKKKVLAFFLVPSFSRSHVWFSLLSWPFPVPPIIEPFTFQEGLSEGMRTRTVCGVAAGDPPLTISWLKDGQSPFPLPPNLASVANISQLDPYSSLLSITNLAAEHSGDYTCVAANPAAEVRYTAKLQVKGN